MVSMDRRRVLIGIGAVAGTVGAGAAYQTIGSELAEREHPPPGELIDVGDHRLHLHARETAGDDAPTVVIEAGSGAWSLDWHHVGTALSTSRRVVTYDRAGYGWSDPGPTPRTARRIANELLRALSAAGIDGPYVLVGHSFGGYTTRLVADAIPGDVAGVVLVDSRQEEIHSRIPAEVTEQQPPLDLFRKLARLGLVRATIDVWGTDAPGLPPTLGAMDPGVQETYLEIGYRPAYFQAVLDEGAVIKESDDQVRETGGLGDIPLVVLSHGVPDMFEGLSREGANAAERVWQDGQRKLARLSTNGTRIVAEDAGHNVQFDQPELVIRSIRDLVERGRRA